MFWGTHQQDQSWYHQFLMRLQVLPVERRTRPIWSRRGTRRGRSFRAWREWPGSEVPAKAEESESPSQLFCRDKTGSAWVSQAEQVNRFRVELIARVGRFWLNEDEAQRQQVYSRKQTESIMRRRKLANCARKSDFRRINKGPLKCTERSDKRGKNIASLIISEYLISGKHDILIVRRRLVNLILNELLTESSWPPLFQRATNCNQLHYWPCLMGIRRIDGPHFGDQNSDNVYEEEYIELGE